MANSENLTIISENQPNMENILLEKICIIIVVQNGRLITADIFYGLAKNINMSQKHSLCP